MSGTKPAGVLKIVLVGSGKGGVGKTTISANLAMAIARRGASAGIFDADLHGPNVAVLFGIRGASKQQAQRMNLTLGRRDRTPYIPPATRRGVRIMSLGMIVSETDTIRASNLGLLALQTVEDVIWGELDYLIIDLPPGTGEPQNTLLRNLDIAGAVMVTTPHPMALMDTGRSLQQFQESGIRVLGIVENMASLTCPHCGEPISLFHEHASSDRMGSGDVELLGRVPLAPSLSYVNGHDQRAQGDPDNPPETVIFDQIAAKIEQQTKDEPGQ